MSDYTMTDKVKEEAKKRAAEEEKAKKEKKENVSERMKKLAAGSGTSPGFAAADLGAQIAAVTKDANKDNGRLNVKDVAKKVDENS